MRIKFLIIIVFLLIVLNIDANENRNNRICILYYKTKYKTAIANELENRLSLKGIVIEKDLIKNINLYNPGEYDAVIIISGVAIFTPSPKVTRYIKKHNYAKNIIYFCSTEYKGACYGFLDQDKIDIITSASENNNIDEIVDEIIEKINSI